MKSTHKVEIVPVHLEKHPNADSLSIVHIFGGYTCVVRTEDWHEGQLAAYIVPDSLVDTSRPEFSFLQEHSRIKVKKIRGIVSMGLLIPAPIGANIGDNVAEQLGVTRYEPPLDLRFTGESVKAPDGYHPTYDVDSLLRYSYVFNEQELVWVTEKIHGANARFCYINGQMYCGSRTHWKKQDQASPWWIALAQHPAVGEFCKNNPDMTVYGEIYGNVQSLKYGLKNTIQIAVFDILLGSIFLDPLEALRIGKSLPWVPLVSHQTPFYLPKLEALAEGRSLMPNANHVREGIVVKPLHERTHPEIGRVCLKLINPTYLEKSQ